jgi:hypothetical protein
MLLVVSADAIVAEATIAASARVAVLNMVCSFSARLGWYLVPLFVWSVCVSAAGYCVSMIGNWAQKHRSKTRLAITKKCGSAMKLCSLKWKERPSMALLCDSERNLRAGNVALQR